MLLSWCLKKDDIAISWQKLRSSISRRYEIFWRTVHKNRNYFQGNRIFQRDTTGFSRLKHSRISRFFHDLKWSCHRPRMNALHRPVNGSLTCWKKRPNALDRSNSWLNSRCMFITFTLDLRGKAMLPNALSTMIPIEPLNWERIENVY